MVHMTTLRTKNPPGQNKQIWTDVSFSEPLKWRLYDLPSCRSQSFAYCEPAKTFFQGERHLSALLQTQKGADTLDTDFQRCKLFQQYLFFILSLKQKLCYRCRVVVLQTIYRTKDFLSSRTLLSHSCSYLVRWISDLWLTG